MSKITYQSQGYKAALEHLFVHVPHQPLTYKQRKEHKKLFGRMVAKKFACLRKSLGHKKEWEKILE